MKNIKKDLNERILILDGAMGTMLQKYELNASDFGKEKYDGCLEILNETKPEIIEEIHYNYIMSGADIIETNTFGANQIVLREYGLEEKDIELNIRAVEIARKAIEKSNKDVYIAGSMGPTSKSISVTGGVTFEDLKESYYRQVKGLIKGGVDLLLFETVQDTRNLKAGYLGLKRAFEEEKVELPIMISVTIEETGTMLAGQSIDAFYYSIEHMNPISVGLNCATGPEKMEKHLKLLSEISNFSVSCHPNAGLPNEDGLYSETPESLSEKIGKFIDSNYINIVGGCCGTTPEHINSIKNICQNKRPRMFNNDKAGNISGLISVYTKENHPFYVGERTNVIGSRKFKDLIVDEKFEEATEIARLQINGKADVIDICLSNPDRDEQKDVDRFLGEITKFAKIPIMIDSTDIKVVELGLSFLQGKGIVNSLNLESGEDKFINSVNIIKQYGASIVIGLIDEQGMAVSVERKMEIAKRSYDILVNKCNIKEEDIIFDTLVFPIATGDEKYIGSAESTIKAIEEIKKIYPKTKTILGISNISFGLPISAREVLNTVYMNEAYKKGLDYAIVNTEKLISLESIENNNIEISKKLLYETSNNTIDEFVSLYRNKPNKVNEEEKLKLSEEEKLINSIVEGSKFQIEGYIDVLLNKGLSPIDIINNVLMKGMDIVGTKFNNNDLIVSEVLQSAEVMKKSVDILKPHMEKISNNLNKKVMLATVKGDVHDIGKNLVSIILENNCYDIIDLGINVSAEIIREKIKEYKPDVIGLSGLLVKSSQEMVNVVNVFSEANIDIPLFVGGAALTERFVYTKIKPNYKGIVVYNKDAMEALKNINSLFSENENKKDEFLKSLEEKKDKYNNIDVIANNNINTKIINKLIVNDITPIKPNTLDKIILENIDVKEVSKYINYQMLMGKHLGVKGVIDLELDRKEEKAIKIYNEIQKILKENEDYFDLKVIYKFYPVRKNGETIEILDENNKNKIIETFEFPRQETREQLSLVDFVNSKEIDYIGMFVVTSGSKIKQISQELIEKGELMKSHIAFSTGLELAEALAEYTHFKMRQHLGIDKNDPKHISDMFRSDYQGKRYSFGYPSCPDLSDQLKLFRLLNPEDIGIELTEGFMMKPEASVSAVVFSHPQCKYFNI